MITVNSSSLFYGVMNFPALREDLHGLSKKVKISKRDRRSYASCTSFVKHDKKRYRRKYTNRYFWFSDICHAMNIIVPRIYMRWWCPRPLPASRVMHLVLVLPYSFECYHGRRRKKLQASIQYLIWAKDRVWRVYIDGLIRLHGYARVRS